jgi:flagellar basal body rod protein FlgC
LIASLLAERGMPAETVRMNELNEKIANINPSHSDAAENYRNLNI